MTIPSFRSDDVRALRRCALVPVERAERGLVSSFESLAEKGAAGYPNWISIARDGADAARIEDLDAVKSACRSCHQQYQGRYRREHAPVEP